MFSRGGKRKGKSSGQNTSRKGNSSNKRKYDHNKKSGPQGKKRKFSNKYRYANQGKEHEDDIDSNNTPVQEAIKKDESSESEEETMENPFEQLINTFGNPEKRANAIDSDSSEDEESTEEIIDEKVADDSEEDSDASDDESNEESEIEIEIETETIIEPSSKNDVFEKHLLYDLNDDMVSAMQKTPIVYKTTTENWSVLGKLQIQLPLVETSIIIKKVKPVISIEEDRPFAQERDIPKKLHFDKKLLADVVKTQIVNNIPKANSSFVTKDEVCLSELQKEMFSIINNYQDFFYTSRSIENAELLRFTYCLHAANHILKTRNRVIHHNAKLSKRDEVPEEFRDQGLVRPKILIVVPFRDAAYRVINMLIDLILGNADKGSVINKNRFVEEFTGKEISLPKKNPKPDDYEKIFQGNTNDDFKIGLTITKKSIKLYADFYSSDIIISSPLGLRFTIGAEGEPDRDYDFLNSIELLVLDQCELYLMQNYDHLLHILDHLHLQPRDTTHGTDLSRVRTWSLNGLSRYYRQTILLSSLSTPAFNAIFARRCNNYAGKVRVVNNISGNSASISQVFVQVPHVFLKFESKSVIEAAEDRFKFFVSAVLPQQSESLMRQTVVFVASYFDFVRVRNYFKREDVSFVQVCEYSKEAKVARARDMFYHGDAQFMLYTERYHFFNRIRLKGVRHLVFYQPPVFGHFFSELCNLMQEGNMNRKIGNSSNMTVTVMYCKYDQQQLAAIVGTDRAYKMLESDRKVHMLLTDGQ